MCHRIRRRTGSILGRQAVFLQFPVQGRPIDAQCPRRLRNVVARGLKRPGSPPAARLPPMAGLTPAWRDRVREYPAGRAAPGGFPLAVSRSSPTGRRARWHARVRAHCRANRTGAADAPPSWRCRSRNGPSFRRACSENGRPARQCPVRRCLSGGISMGNAAMRYHRSSRNFPFLTSASRFLLLATITRTSTGTGALPPTRWTSRSCSTRNSFA